MPATSAHPHLSRAPILEALVDLRVDPDPSLTLEDLRRMQAALGPDRFPEVVSQRQTKLEIGAQVNVSSLDDHGLLLRSVDQLHAVQAQLSGFTFSRLRPYEDWDELTAGARAAWDHYVAIAKPRRVTRIAVRTINRMELPLPLGDLRDWVRTIPDIPSTLPQAVSEVFARLVLPTQDATVILTEAVEPPISGATHCVVILDIDVFRLAEFPVVGEETWSALAAMRKIKNDFFFECVTQRTVELFR